MKSNTEQPQIIKVENINCPCCGRLNNIRKDFDFPEEMLCCDSCGADFTIDGEIILDTAFNRITINSPKQINSKKILKQTKALMNDGIKAKDIQLVFSFVCSQETANDIMNNFRRITNRIAFNKDLKNGVI
jgi:hypothetical protein